MFRKWILKLFLVWIVINLINTRLNKEYEAGYLLPATYAAVFSCFGTLGNDSSVCSSHGSCTNTDTCTCNSGYYGNQCQHDIDHIPVAQITASNIIGNCDNNVRLDGTKSYVRRSDGLTYNWGCTNDAALNSHLTGLGSNSVVLLTRDNYWTNSASKDITLTVRNSQGIDSTTITFPIAYYNTNNFSFIINQGNKVNIKRSESLNLDVSINTDSICSLSTQGGITFSWDQVSGPTTISTATDSPNSIHFEPRVFQVGGTYVFRAKAFVNDIATSITQEISIVVSATDPVAIITGGSKQISNKISLELHADNSYDPDQNVGDTATYSWSCDNCSFTIANGVSNSITPNSLLAGQTYKITLTYSLSPSGRSSSVTEEFEIVNNAVPTPEITYIPNKVINHHQRFSMEVDVPEDSSIQTKFWDERSGNIDLDSTTLVSRSLNIRARAILALNAYAMDPSTTYQFLYKIVTKEAEAYSLVTIRTNEIPTLGSLTLSSGSVIQYTNEFTALATGWVSSTYPLEYQFEAITVLGAIKVLKAFSGSNRITAKLSTTGSYTIRVKIRNKDGGMNIATTSLTVTNIFVNVPNTQSKIHSYLSTYVKSVATSSALDIGIILNNVVADSDFISTYKTSISDDCDDSCENQYATRKNQMIEKLNIVHQKMSSYEALNDYNEQYLSTLNSVVSLPIQSDFSSKYSNIPQILSALACTPNLLSTTTAKTTLDVLSNILDHALEYQNGTLVNITKSFSIEILDCIATKVLVPKQFLGEKGYSLNSNYFSIAILGDRLTYLRDKSVTNGLVTQRVVTNLTSTLGENIVNSQSKTGFYAVQMKFVLDPFTNITSSRNFKQISDVSLVKFYDRQSNQVELSLGDEKLISHFDPPNGTYANDQLEVQKHYDSIEARCFYYDGDEWQEDSFGSMCTSTVSSQSASCACSTSKPVGIISIKIPTIYVSIFFYVFGLVAAMNAFILAISIAIFIVILSLACSFTKYRIKEWARFLKIKRIRKKQLWRLNRRIKIQNREIATLGKAQSEGVLEISNYKHDLISELLTGSVVLLPTSVIISEYARTITLVHTELKDIDNLISLENKLASDKELTKFQLNEIEDKETNIRKLVPDRFQDQAHQFTNSSLPSSTVQLFTTIELEEIFDLPYEMTNNYQQYLIELDVDIEIYGVQMMMDRVSMFLSKELTPKLEKLPRLLEEKERKQRELERMLDVVKLIDVLRSQIEVRTHMLQQLQAETDSIRSQVEEQRKKYEENQAYIIKTTAENIQFRKDNEITENNCQGGIHLIQSNIKLIEAIKNANQEIDEDVFHLNYNVKEVEPITKESKSTNKGLFGKFKRKRKVRLIQDENVWKEWYSQNNVPTFSMNEFCCKYCKTYACYGILCNSKPNPRIKNKFPVQHLCKHCLFLRLKIPFITQSFHNYYDSLEYKEQRVLDNRMELEHIASIEDNPDVLRFHHFMARSYLLSQWANEYMKTANLKSNILSFHNLLSNRLGSSGMLSLPQVTDILMSKASFFVRAAVCHRSVNNHYATISRLNDAIQTLHEHYHKHYFKPIAEPFGESTKRLYLDKLRCGTLLGSVYGMLSSHHMQLKNDIKSSLKCLSNSTLVLESIKLRSFDSIQAANTSQMKLIDLYMKIKKTNLALEVASKALEYYEQFSIDVAEDRVSLLPSNHDGQADIVNTHRLKAYDMKHIHLLHVRTMISKAEILTSLENQALASKLYQGALGKVLMLQKDETNDHSAISEMINDFKKSIRNHMDVKLFNSIQSKASNFDISSSIHDHLDPKSIPIDLLDTDDDNEEEV